MRIECVVPGAARMGEGAVWDERTQSLWWVDIYAGLIHRYNPADRSNATYAFGEPVGSVALRADGGLVVAAKSGFWIYDPDSGRRILFSAPEAGRPENRFNDGNTDMQGRFWAGTLKHGGDPEPLGRLYRLDPDGSCFPWIDGFYTINGVAFSPDGRVMYFSDSHPRVRTIWRCEYDIETGTPGTPSILLATLGAVAGRPDGATVDAEGFYWTAGVSGWQIYRISPSGRIDMTVDLPIEKPSRPMFGGPDFETLYLTTLGQQLTESSQSQQPDAGGLFAITGLGVKGCAQQRFSHHPAQHRLF